MLPIQSEPPSWRAHWMETLREELRDIPLRRVCLPGTHDSGAYELDHHVVPGQTFPDWLASLLNSRWLRCLGCSKLVTSVGIAWSLAQSMDLGQQLRRGVRYLDLRVAVVDGAFHFVHSFRGPAVAAGLQQVATFLREHPAEVLLLDFNHIYNFDSVDRHLEFLHLVREHLGDKMAPSSVGLDVTHAHLVRDGKQVLAFYAGCERFPQTVAHAAELGFWPCRETHVRAPWPRADTVEAFLPRLHTIARDTAAQTTFYVLQGVLTPRADAVLRGLFMRPSSLREFSLRAHPTVHELAAWGDHRTRCVVMVDFLSDYLIDQLIRNNVSGEQQPRHRSEGWNGDGGGSGLGAGLNVGVGGGSRIGVAGA